MHVYNHEWADPETFITLGVIPQAEIEEMSEGRLHEPVTVRVNRMVMEYDHLLICGPVFPHEVVGFSGGNKYLYPGISGPEVINFSHWLGALITNARMIGMPGITPVRRMINRASAFIPTPDFVLRARRRARHEHARGPRVRRPGRGVGRRQQTSVPACMCATRTTPTTPCSP